MALDRWLYHFRLAISGFAYPHVIANENGVHAVREPDLSSLSTSIHHAGIALTRASATECIRGRYQAGESASEDQS